MKFKFRSYTLQILSYLSVLLSFFSKIFLGIYRTIFTTHLGGNCRFEPSCSSYALECYHKHSFLKASLFTLKRLLKCHPFGSFGYDPVPDSIIRRNNAK